MVARLVLSFRSPGTKYFRANMTCLENLIHS